jgi:flagellar L-ring protein precursor FlgH
MKMTRYLISIFTLGTLVLSGCSGIESKSHPAYAPMEPIVYTMPTEGVTPASLYSEQRGLSLFADTRARSVGDIITVMLMESTQASKECGYRIEPGVRCKHGAPHNFWASQSGF